MVMENPGWYTPYTPYQAEIAQGRLESLLNFQTMVADLTGMEVANASLLDEATAAAEAMTLLHRVRTAEAGAGERASSWSATAACRRRSTCCGRAPNRSASTLRVVPVDGDDVRRPAASSACCCSIRTNAGLVEDLAPFIARAHEAGVLVAVGTDLLALALLNAARRDGRRRRVRQLAALRRAARLRRTARRVLRHAQRLRPPDAGPHHRRVGRRRTDDTAYRMALATREQHIRREKATSNICTAQALLANMAAMYAVYHGPDGLRAIATRVHALTGVLEAELHSARARQTECALLRHAAASRCPAAWRRFERARSRAGINFRYVDDRTVGIALNETVTTDDVRDIVRVFAERPGQADAPELDLEACAARWRVLSCRRCAGRAPFLTHPVFNTHRSETRDDALHPRRSSGRTSASTRR